MFLCRVVRERRNRQWEDSKVGRAVDGVAKYGASTFASGDKNEVVACGEREDTEDAVNGPRRC